MGKLASFRVTQEVYDAILAAGDKVTLLFPCHEKRVKAFGQHTFYPYVGESTTLLTTRKLRPPGRVQCWDGVAITASGRRKIAGIVAGVSVGSEAPKDAVIARDALWRRTWWIITIEHLTTSEIGLIKQEQALEKKLAPLEKKYQEASDRMWDVKRELTITQRLMGVFE